MAVAERVPLQPAGDAGGGELCFGGKPGRKGEDPRLRCWVIAAPASGGRLKRDKKRAVGNGPAGPAQRRVAGDDGRRGRARPRGKVRPRSPCAPWGRGRASSLGQAEGPDPAHNVGGWHRGAAERRGAGCALRLPC